MTYPILDRLLHRRIFSVGPTNTGTFEFQEACDYYFTEQLSRDELIALGKELIEMATNGNTNG